MKKIRRLLFVHIPKTAGISLHSQLEKAFPASQSIRFGNRTANARFPQMGPEQFQNFAYITGHQSLPPEASEALEGNQP